MLTIEAIVRVARQVWTLPVLSRVGLGLMMMGGVADIVIHLAVDSHAHHGHGPAEQAHLLGIVGMVLVLAGVMVFGARRRLRVRSIGGNRDAHR